MKRVLLIEDDAQMAELIYEYLLKYDIRCEIAKNGKDAIKGLKEAGYDLIILDLSLPDIDGIELCKDIRNRYKTPIIISSARGELSDKVLGFEMGADDYLAKPYEPRELVARIKARLRTFEDSGKQERLRIDENGMDVYLQGEKANLSGTEFQILKYLKEHPKRAISREEMLDSIDTLRYESLNRTIDVHISKIRQKLKTLDKEQEYIKSVWGVGYMYCGE